MSISEKITGVANVGGLFKNIIINEDGDFSDKNIKELIYSTEYGEVEALFGFSDLKITEVNDDSPAVHQARVFLSENKFAQGIIFLEDGFLIVTDLSFFSGYTRINNKETPYVTLVESNTYEDEVALNMIEEDPRLQ